MYPSPVHSVPAGRGFIVVVDGGCVVLSGLVVTVDVSVSELNVVVVG